MYAAVQDRGSDSVIRRQHPPAPLRTHSELNTLVTNYTDEAQRAHIRHKSTSLVSDASRRSPGYARRVNAQAGAASSAALATDRGAPSIPEETQLEVPTTTLSPPLTPTGSQESTYCDKSTPAPEIIMFDFTKLDYELERAKVLGRGLWSTVWLADGKVSSSRRVSGSPPTPPVSPRRNRYAGPSSLYAVKMPARADATDVFRQEAKVLSCLMQQTIAAQYIVGFQGLDTRCSSLVFEAVLGGSLENLNDRLRQMTEVARHIELVNLFPGLADDLIRGLDFLHSSGVVHADLKPANIMLDISEHYSLPRPVVRARYIDFSASFRLNSDDSTLNSGGTWDYMAPEQLRISKEFSTPTFASDVWSLAVTLLSLIVGGSPYAAACGENLFMLREAIKSGDPFGFARMSPIAGKRMAACQEFIDCCRQGLKKDRGRRITAGAWKTWFASQELGA
ncbi:hypothetical protein LTR56_023235 [Elasticomyces elasticus]|nr:hypothetical protein LTR56_023235 [Elasticomyces elasticus]KAK3626150.1 hypothetical protein LTR22_023271 [Elasticomyces elasticus]KAK4907247.1 hypothetical protein LTR49_023709 [Elasticomyces elasticus]KAK5758922.1 hypothetical protein LTS12_011015 [Elasticomyces elasticus]